MLSHRQSNSVKSHRQNNSRTTVYSATCSFNNCAEQSHKDTVRKATVEEQLSSKTILQLWEPSSTSPVLISPRLWTKSCSAQKYKTSNRRWHPDLLTHLTSAPATMGENRWFIFFATGKMINILEVCIIIKDRESSWKTRYNLVHNNKIISPNYFILKLCVKVYPEIKQKHDKWFSSTERSVFGTQLHLTSNWPTLFTLNHSN